MSGVAPLSSSARLLLLLLGIHASVLAAQQSTPSTRWAPVEAAMGRSGAAQPGDVIKFGFPRSDLTVTVGTVTLKPALALGG